MADEGWVGRDVGPVIRRLREDLLGLVRSVEDEDWVEERESKEEVAVVVVYREAADLVEAMVGSE